MNRETEIKKGNEGKTMRRSVGREENKKDSRDTEERE